MNPRYNVVAERAGHRCEYCRAPEGLFNFPFEVEHIVPQARGGDQNRDNLALACHACNLFKSDAQTGTPDPGAAPVALYNPRRDTWTEHFVLDPETAVITGKTPVGSATVARLQLNQPQHLRARRFWISENLFP